VVYETVKELFMEKINGVSRISALLLVFVLVGFAGCGTTPQAGLPDKADSGQSGGGSGTEDGRAAQLAADLGKAVSGGTVTLSGWVGLKTTLTIPEGVTLDLTADGAGLELQDGAVLTVDGAVNATGHGDHGSGWVDGSLRIGDGEAVIAGSGTIYLKSKGRLLNIGSDKARRQLTLDGVTLVGLEDNDNPLIGIYENGGLVMKSGAITGNTRTSGSGGGVEVHKGTFAILGGAISGNSARAGGGVYVWQGKFAMEGGEISGNSAQGNIDGNNYGGGVSVGGEGGEFVMRGGAIKENTVTSGRFDQGGGVYVTDQGAAIMEGGEISGNSAIGKTMSFGGGVYVGTSPFLLNGGRIQGGTDSDGFAANTISGSTKLGAALNASSTRWGTGGTYTKGGKPQAGGSDIGTTDDTLIAIPGK
jgi:hypothetical protein